MSNIPEETGHATRTAINALKGNPLCLSLVLLIAIIMGLLYLRVTKEMESDQAIVQSLIERCMEPAKR